MAEMPGRERARAELASALRGVGGWLDDDEAWALHEAVRCHPASRTALTVVEIGSWKGRATIVLASGLRARGGGSVYAIDPHADTALHAANGEESTYDSFLANVRTAEVESYVRSVRARSAEARSRFADRSVDMLFVDGSHEYEDVLRDIDDWTPALQDVATVGFHDIVGYPGVTRALHERVLRDGSPFLNRRIVERTLLLDFRRRLL
jgi:hypothetical protein